MTNDEDFLAYVDRMPADEDLLAPVGRVAWAAASLHHAIRDALNVVGGQPSDEPWEDTLGRSLSQLREKASALGTHEGRLLDQWCRRDARPAVQARNAVLHGVVYTAEDGHPALRRIDGVEPVRWSTETLLTVCGQLVYASTTMPPVPHP